MKLSDTQLVILSAASQRPDRNLLPLPANLKGGAQQKVIGSLLAKNLAAEVTAGSGALVWRTDEDGARLTLRARDAAFQALGIEIEPSAGDRESPQAAPERRARKQERPGAVDSTDSERQGEGSRQPRTHTKQAQLIAMLKQPEGASLDEIVAATGWQAHTVRGAIAGALKKKLGLMITSEKVEGRGRVYHIPE